MKLLGLGDNVVDRYRNKGWMFPGGNAVNVAAHASKLGLEAAYLGRLADDEEGIIIQESLHDLHVDITHCDIVKNGTTKRCDVDVFEGERFFIGVDLGDNWPGILNLTPAHIEYMEGFDLIHSSCNAKMEDEIKKLASLSGIVTFDFGEKPKYRVDEYLHKICPYIDLALFSANDLTTEKLHEFARHVHDFGVQHVLITKGQDGSYLYNGDEFYRGSVKLVKAKDTMGAGDSYLAAFIVSMLKDGWKKHQKMSGTSIQNALLAAADYAAENCMIDGGYGYLHQYTPE